MRRWFPVAMILILVWAMEFPHQGEASERKAEDRSAILWTFPEGWRGEDGRDTFSNIPEESASNELSLPFAKAPEMSRVAIDFDIRSAPQFVDFPESQRRLDLTHFDSLELRLRVTDPAAIGGLTLYLRSGRGWYSMAGNVMGGGAQKLIFPIRTDQIEGSPDGLDQIDGFRIAFWRGVATDTTVKLYTLRAVRFPILLLESSTESSETATAKSCAAEMFRLLRSMDVPVRSVPENRLHTATLTGRRVVILPYNPDMASDTIESLKEWLETTPDSRLIAFYQLSPELCQATGLERLEYMRLPDGERAFTSVRFTSQAVQDKGYPSVFHQNSFNINRVVGDFSKIRVLGTWYNALGNPTESAAVVATDRCVFFTHVFLGQDPANQRQLLTAMVGECFPEIWYDFAWKEWSSLHRIGGRSASDGVEWFEKLPTDQSLLTEEERKTYPTLGEAIDLYEQIQEDLIACRDFAMEPSVHTEQILHEISNSSDPIDHLFLGQEIPLNSQRIFASQERLRSIASRASQLRPLFEDLFIRSLGTVEKYDPRTGSGEVRAWWEHAGTGIYRGDWERTMKELSDAGFTHIISNMVWAGSAHYDSQFIPSDDIYRQYGDQVAQAVAAGKKYGIQVHVWKVCYNLGTASADFIERMRRENRTQVRSDGSSESWLCPSHPANQELEIASLCELVEKYEIDGIHFDYIRYPDSDVCFCDGCRARFESDTGHKVEHWPQDCTEGPLKEAYIDWRCVQITRVVSAVHERAKNLRPNIQISAAVFPLYPSSRRGVLQDWKHWVESGYLDFLCPMSYNSNPAAFEGWIERELEQVNGQIPVYPGIGATSTGNSMTPDQVAAEIDATRRSGAAGFTIFNLDARTAERFLKRLTPILAPNPIPKPI